MRVKIEKISCCDSVTIVHFTCQFGAARGHWGSREPRLNSEYEVELDIGVPLKCDVNFRLTRRALPRCRVQSLIGGPSGFD